MTIVEFLRARLDEEAEAARAANDAPGRWIPDGYGNVNAAEIATSGPTVTHIATAETGAIAVHIVRHSPARVLREVDAKRKRLAEYEAVLDGLDLGVHEDRVLHETAFAMVAADAEVYSDHPDYDTAWAVALDN